MAIYLVDRQSKNQRFQELNNKGTFAAKWISEINFPISFLNFLLFSFEFFLGISFSISWVCVFIWDNGFRFGVF